MVNWVGLGRAMLRMRTASAYVELHQATSRTFDPYMPAVVVAAVVGDLALAVVATSPAGRLAAGVDGLLYGVVLALSLLTNVRLNRRIDRWSVADPPAEWDEVRRRWVGFHVLRTFVSLPALGATILAATSLAATAPLSGS